MKEFTTQKEINMLEVKTDKAQIVAIIVLGLFFVPMGFGLLYSGISKGLKPVPIGIGVACLAMFALVFWIVFRAHRKSVRTFTSEGLTRNDGRQFAWTELERVVDKMARRRGGGLFIWRCELRFKNGEAAWVIPSKVANFAEVAALIRTLPCEHAQEAA
jgi:hypothetical protein